MSKNQFTGKMPWQGWIISLAVLIYLIAAVLFIPSSPSKVEAQFGGQPTFSVPFTVNVPAGTGPGIPHQYVSVPNRGQISEVVSYAWLQACNPASPGGPSATFSLEGSNDNTNWFALSTSAALSGTPSSSILYNNGYFTYKRLSFPLCGNAFTVKGVYVGYGVPLPINRTATALVFDQNIEAFRAFGPLGWYALNGFQCYNPGSAVAYLAFQGIVTNGGFEVIGIPAGALYDYQGPALIGNGASTVYGAFTNAGLLTPVSTPVECTFQLSGGPLYPASPPVAF